MLTLLFCLIWTLLLLSKLRRNDRLKPLLAVFMARSDLSDVRLAPVAVREPTIGNLTVMVKKVIESRELFRRPDIKISDIARLLNTNRTYISAALNRDLKVSFSTLINGYRIDYAKRLIAEAGVDLSSGVVTLPDIIEMSGFSNESSFYRTFKALTGTTPRRWLSEQVREG